MVGKEYLAEAIRALLEDASLLREVATGLWWPAFEPMGARSCRVSVVLLKWCFTVDCGM
jgi:hypothetical protein